MSKTRLESKKIRKTFVRQHSRFYCGLACLASIIRYHGGSVSQQKLQSMSGTTLNGTSMLGLCQAARSLGFDAGGYEGGPGNLKELNEPVILHTVTPEGLEHFVVCYGFSGGKFLIGDPARGVVKIPESELDDLWKSKALLKLVPGPEFKTSKAEAKRKREWFMGLIRPDLPVLAIAAVIGLVISVLGLATAIFTQKLLDEFIPGRYHDKLVPGLAILCLVLVARAVVSYIRTAFLIRTAKDMNIRITDVFFGKLLTLPKPFFDSTTTGDLIARLNDTQRIQRVVVALSSQVVIDLLIVITSWVYIAVVSVTTGLISLMVIPVFGVVTWFYNQKIIQSQREVMQSYASSESRFIDTLQGIKAIKSFNNENLFSRIAKAVYGAYMQCVYQLGLVTARFSFWTSLGSSVWMVMLIAWVTWQVFEGKMMIGQMMAIITIAGSLGTSAIGIAMAAIQFQEARIAFDRMFEFSSVDPEYDPAQPFVPMELRREVDFRLSVKGLCFRFPGKRLLLHNINLEAETGRIMAISGAVGSGKSTLFDILLRFHQPEKGSITLNGLDWSIIHTKEWRSLVGWVPQHVSLFNATILGNIAIGEEVDPDQVIMFCKQLGFHEFIQELPQGYATLVSECSGNLSGGQRQLIALARALYRKPRLLLLDEATAAMDQRTETFVIELLRKLKGEMAIMLITHRPHLAEAADALYIIGERPVPEYGNLYHYQESNKS